MCNRPHPYIDEKQLYKEVISDLVAYGNDSRVLLDAQAKIRTYGDDSKIDVIVQASTYIKENISDFTFSDTQINNKLIEEVIVPLVLLSDNPKDFIQINGGINITNPWVEGLELIVNGAVDVNRATSKTWQTPWELYAWDGVTESSAGLTANVRSPFTDPRLRESNNSVLNTNLSGQIKYNITFGENHDFELFAGATKEKFSGSNFFAFRRNYISPAIDQLFAGGADDQLTGGSGYERTRLGYYGSLKYNFNCLLKPLGKH